jgi:uncharacterized membrane protein
MDSETANRIVWVLSIFIVVCILLIVIPIMYDILMTQVKNNSGELASMNLIMITLGFVLFFVLLSHLSRSKQYRRSEKMA